MAVSRWTDGPVSAVMLDDPSDVPLVEWDRFVAETPGSDVSQLNAWARVRSATGCAPLYVLVHRDGELVAGAQILERRLPVLGKIGYIAYGPVIDPSISGREHVRRVLGRALDDLARHRLRMLFIQPPEGAEDISQELLQRGFRFSDAGIAPPGSVRVDLKAAEEELRGRLRNQRLRRLARTNKWEAKGVRARVGGGEDVPVLAELMVHTARHQGFEPFSAGYLRSLYRELAMDGHVALFLGEIDGVPVATHLYTACGDTLRFRLTGFDRSRDTARVGVPGVLHWEALRWAKANGYRWFDFGGLSSVSLRTLLDGDGDVEAVASHDRFKSDFGGMPFRYPPPVELISSIAVRGVYDLARRGAAGRRLVAKAQRRMRGGRSRAAGSNERAR